jgi:hypothetical protein
MLYADAPTPHSNRPRKKKKLEGVKVRVFGPAKTVADCFKYRKKIGLELALEALRDCSRQRKATMDELCLAAKVCRVARVMHLTWSRLREESRG